MADGSGAPSTSDKEGMNVLYLHDLATASAQGSTCDPSTFRNTSPPMSKKDTNLSLDSGGAVKGGSPPPPLPPKGMKPGGAGPSAMTNMNREIPNTRSKTNISKLNSDHHGGSTFEKQPKPIQEALIEGCRSRMRSENYEREVDIVCPRINCPEKLMCNFTNNPSKLITILDDMDNCFPTENCDLSSLFETIYNNTSLPHVAEPRVTPPPYIVRTIFIYGRSHIIPKSITEEHQKLLMSSPFYFLDIFYIHEPPSEENSCEAIFDMLCDLDEKGLFYVFEVSRNPTKLYDSIAMLLPHPLQRPLQRDACYSIDSLPNATDLASSRPRQALTSDYSTTPHGHSLK